MSTHKPWQPRVRGEPIFNPFEPSTDWTRDLGANERVEVPDEDEATSEDQVKPKDEQSPAK
jgi:hypothetical protein